MTASEKIKALGGATRVATLLGKNYSTVAMWGQRNRIPFVYEFMINAQLRKKGYDI